MSQLSTEILKWFTCYDLRPEAMIRFIGFPHSGSGPQAFREWGQLLPDHIELLSLNLPGRGKRLDEPMITEMGDLTAHIVEALCGYFDKPFVFFGHSVGAAIAFDVALELETRKYPTPLHLFVSAYVAPDQQLFTKRF